ncbi:actin organization and endocytosis protein [Coemansia sp. 'formosensis']|nr:actin organization and endocytosis protein [Coemansia sp. 'formosensis']
MNFIPPADIPTYTATFNSNVTAGATRIGGDAARRVLMQSRLPVNELGRIWELSDTRRTGSLSLPEFMLAMFLAQSRIKGKALPDSLPPKIAAEVAAATSTTPVISQQQLSMPAAIGMSGPIGMTPNIGMPDTTQFNMPAPTQFNAPVTSQFNAPPPTQFAMPAPAQYNAPAPAQFNTPAPTQFSMPAPLHYTPSAEPESIQTFESQFPDISLSPSSGLNLVKQTFNSHPISSSTQPQWTITPSERAQYEGIFRRWDSGRGVLRGDQAREVFAQSSLSQTDLAKIWMLADTSNQGELNLDEFSVAMHLIFRRLAGAPIPDVLPQELVPRSSKDFMSSLTEMKEQLMVKRPSATPSAAPSASLLNDVNDFDDDGIYQSANRRRNQGSNTPSVDTRSHSPSGPSAATAESVDQLRRLVQQRKDDIQKARSDSERRHKERAESRVTGRWRIDDLKREIEDIHRNTPLADNDEGGGDRGRLLAKRQRLVASINELLLIMPALANDCERIAREVADTSKSLGRKKQDKPPLSDMEARAARLVAQRMAALTGEPLIEDDDEPEDDRVVKAERKLRESRERVQTITSGVDHVTRAMRDLPSSSKWEDGVGVVSQEVRDFVTRLSSIERQAPIRTSAFSPVISKEEEKEEVEETKKPLTIAERLALATNKQERDRILQDIAEERFRDRQRALGIPDPSESAPPSVAAKRPEMQERVPVASNPFAAAAAAAEPVSPPVSVPTYASVPSFVSAPAAAPVSAPSFASVPVSTPAIPVSVSIPAPAAAEPFGDDSSEEDEWDRDDSSDDDELPPPLGPELFGAPATGPAARVESPVSTVSFDTAFANPAAATPPAPLALKDESNPFLGLLSATTAEFEKLRLRALYPYHPDADDELAIETGDLIETLPVPASQKAVRGDGWLYGGILEESDVDDGWKLGSRTGWFPRDYAETLGAPGTRGWIKTKALFGTAKYDYEPQHEDELKVSVGQRVRVVDGDAAESWWKVRVIGTGTAGMLPAMYIDVDK